MVFDKMLLGIPEMNSSSKIYLIQRMILQVAYGALEGSPLNGMNSFVNVQRGFLTESF